MNQILLLFYPITVKKFSVNLLCIDVLRRNNGKDRSLHRRILIDKLQIFMSAFRSFHNIPEIFPVQFIKQRFRTLAQTRQLFSVLSNLNNSFLFLILLQHGYRQVPVLVRQRVLVCPHLAVGIDRPVVNRKNHMRKGCIDDLVAVYAVAAAILHELFPSVHHITRRRPQFFQFIRPDRNLLRQHHIAVLYHAAFP